MAKTNIGRVSVVPKDKYSSTENYKRLDVVNGDGSMYISKKDNNIGNPLTDENWWFKAVEKGEVGPQGEKPVNGVDYNTPEEKEEFKNDVVSKATEEVEKNIADIEAEAIENYNNNADAKTEEYDTNANRKLTAYNDNATQKTEEYNSNATSKVSEYNMNASTQIETFNNNATIKTNAFNDNYDEKMQAINEASTSIEAERKISDSKYARALKTPVTDVESTQIYAENDVVDDLIIKGAPLTQEIREGYNKFYLPQTSFDIIGLNVNIKNSNELTIKGIPTSTYCTKDFIRDDFKTIIENGKTYTILAIPNFRTETTRLAYHIAWYNSDSEVVYRISPTIWLSNGKAIKVFTPEFEQEISYFTLTLEGMIKDAEYDFDLRIMMVEGEYTEDNIPEFELYGASPSLDFPSEVQVASEQNITINETNITIPLVNSAIGQYTDTIDRENNVQNKVIQEFIFDGTEDWRLGAVKEITQVFTLNINLSCEQTGMSNYLSYKSGVDEELFTYAGNVIYIAVNKTRASTPEEFKALLSRLNSSGNPLKIYLVRKTPITNPLSEEVKQELNKFKLYDNLNNVFIGKGTLSFKYNKSLSKELEEKDEMIDNLLTRVQALEQAQVDNVGGN